MKLPRVAVAGLLFIAARKAKHPPLRLPQRTQKEIEPTSPSAGLVSDATPAPIEDVIPAAIANAASSGVSGDDLVAVAISAGVDPAIARAVASAAGSAAGTLAPIAEVIQAALDSGASLGRAQAVASVEAIQQVAADAGVKSSVALQSSSWWVHRR
ncbi:hypothetical protein SPRG_11690 [Saprolegnia parasitica CBS 223.65]|uniref:Uncharacterized protein n=1 Tax=Saprolegnia parasitica (strain CBS 223.65) TaxID=695850 RepID=A0A067C7G7_SAPPC|nr:hypothetical protein SPRG_11690 [Saprolegnia parasitica CBS 223.65]KDO22506.1 hypothetical protein SPRG_11690 [Saprolegnia parasitica CBS 223.65]|eukprot:XP_012206754.1 hypothetical protein SPRG_11690 [Saprolegnia parasitica CBS 223.65]